jgi:hypothetical protein
MTIPSVGSMLPLPHFAPIVERSHRHYRLAEILPILEYLDQPILPYGAITRMSKDTGIPKQTLSDGAHQRREPAMPNWFPFESGCPLKHVLPPTVEEALADHIRENWIQRGKGSVRQTVQTLAKTVFPSLPVKEMPRERFAASANWLDGFMARQGLSTPSPHPERRTSIDQEYAGCFLDQLNQAKHQSPSNRIFDFEATCSKRYLGPNKVLAEREAGQ